MPVEPGLMTLTKARFDLWTARQGAQVFGMLLLIGRAGEADHHRMARQRQCSDGTALLRLFSPAKIIVDMRHVAGYICRDDPVDTPQRIETAL